MTRALEQSFGKAILFREPEVPILIPNLRIVGARVTCSKRSGNYKMAPNVPLEHNHIGTGNAFLDSLPSLRRATNQMASIRPVKGNATAQ